MTEWVGSLLFGLSLVLLGGALALLLLDRFLFQPLLEDLEYENLRVCRLLRLFSKYRHTNECISEAARLRKPCCPPGCDDRLFGEVHYAMYGCPPSEEHCRRSHADAV